MPPQRTAPAPQPAGTREQGDSYACARAWAALTAAHAALTERLSEALLDRLSPDEHNQLTEVLGRIAKT
jgi:hypothetical protein